MTTRAVGIPNPTPGNVQQTLQRLVEVVNALQGASTTAQRAIRLQDLLTAGVLQTTQNGELVLAIDAGGTASDDVPLPEGDGAPGVLETYSRADHEHPWSGTNASQLHPIEKRLLRIDFNKLANDHDGLLALADLAGVTIEKAAYEASFDALSAYLASLTTPVAWDDKAGPTVLP